MIRLLISKDTERSTIHVSAFWETPNDGIRPSHSNTLHNYVHGDEAADMWIDGIAAAIEATHGVDVKITSKRGRDHAA